MADRAIRDIMEQSIEELPDELRTAFVACVVDGVMQFAEFFALTSEAVDSRLHNAQNLLVIRHFSLAFGEVYWLDDGRSERITNAVMDRLFPRR